MKRLVMHSDVNVASKFFIGILVFSTIVQTYQEDLEIKTWNNRLYPTNSVYELPKNVQTPSLQNNVVASSLRNPDEVSEPQEDTGSVEIEYEDDYEAEGSHEISKESPEVKNPRNETHYETKVENSKDYDSYYYYDEYDNVTTNSHAGDVGDYEMVDESLSFEKNGDDGNSSSFQTIIETEAKNKQIESEEGILIEEAVVSVVTTKSVVNGTISVPTSMPSTTEQMIRPPMDLSSSNSTESREMSSTTELSETTKDSIIVASVQTSRSISGARFLPFNLNGEKKNIEKNETEKKILHTESTESIIDKLDRVQSELSSGFLSGGFRSAGNALQLDVLSEQRPTTKKPFTTTGKTPVISKFLSRQRYNDRKPITATTEAAVTSSSTTSIEILKDQTSVEKSKISFRWPSSSRKATIPKTSRTTTRKTPTKAATIGTQDISAFLPPGYRLNSEDKTTEKSLLSEILAKSKVDLSSLLPSNYPKSIEVTTEKESLSEIPKVPIQKLFEKTEINISAFLPPDYNKKIKPESQKGITESPSTTPASSPIQKTLQELFSKSSVDISALLPSGYNPAKKSEIKVPEKSTTNTPIVTKVNISTIEMTSKAPGGIKLVFPSRPGGRKAVVKATAPQNRFGGDVPTPVTPKIQKGWPTRLTTEFTGWPTPSTTAISIEKLLEAARTATVSAMNPSITPIMSESSTESTTTTTTTTVRPTTPGICDDECEVAGTIRIVGNATWVPELLDRNTNEWQQLANEIEKEMNLVFIKSAILRKWYKNVRIDAFSPGSILVDYFIELQELSQRINTQELKVLFHDSLRTYNAHRWNETRTKGPVRLGEYVIDPKSTDFVVIPKLNLPQQVEKDDRLIPQWAIAIIVIGVGGLLFIIVFGVSVLVNRQNTSRLKPPVLGMYGEDAAKNIIHASHVTTSNRSSHDYPKSEISTIWNDTDAWRDKSFESQSHKVLMEGMLPDEKKYNVYDSWRSEWNGYYYQPSHTSSKFAGYESTATNYSRHPPDYDTNF